jgi:hypothetical protein
MELKIVDCELSDEFNGYIFEVESPDERLYYLEGGNKIEFDKFKMHVKVNTIRADNKFEYTLIQDKQCMNINKLMKTNDMYLYFNADYMNMTRKMKMIIMEYLRDNNIPLIILDSFIIRNNIMENIKELELEGVVLDNISAGYKIKYEVDKNSVTLSDKYLDRIKFNTEDMKFSEFLAMACEEYARDWNINHFGRMENDIQDFHI